MPKRFLIVHLMSMGDCVMMTTLARQIKKDNENCHLTWAISYKCRQIIENNPDIDSIWEVKYSNEESPFSDVWIKVKNEAEERKRKGEFDEIIYSQILPDNLHHYDGTTKSSTFRAYSHPITVNPVPVIYLTETEIHNARTFSVHHCLENFKHVILCECTPSSGQSFMSLPIMISIAEKIIASTIDTVFIISTHISIESSNDRIIVANNLSYRENAALSHHCTFLVGCSSGITWLLTSIAAKKLNTVQFISITDAAFQFASVEYDFKYWGLPTDHILETDVDDPVDMSNIIELSLINFQEAKLKYGKSFKPTLKSLENNVRNLLYREKFKAIYKTYYSTSIFFKRNKLKGLPFAYYSKLLFKILKNQITKRISN